MTQNFQALQNSGEQVSECVQKAFLLQQQYQNQFSPFCQAPQYEAMSQPQNIEASLFSKGKWYELER